MEFLKKETHKNTIFFEKYGPVIEPARFLLSVCCDSSGFHVGDAWSFFLTSASKFNIEPTGVIDLFEVSPKHDRASPNVKTLSGSEPGVGEFGRFAVEYAHLAPEVVVLGRGSRRVQQNHESVGPHVQDPPRVVLCQYPIGWWTVRSPLTSGLQNLPRKPLLLN